MKAFVVVLLGALALAQAEVNWSNVQPMSLNTLPFYRPPTGNRIVGGEEAVPHSLPYQVALFVTMGGRIAFCGGSLISPNYVLTAAHCVQTAESIEVAMGAHKVTDPTEPTQVRMVTTDFKHHEDWSMLTLRHDIALIKLPQSVELNENIQLVKLPTREQAEASIDKETVVASGWGKDTDQATAVSPVLRRITVPVLPNESCKWYFFGVIQDTHMCTNSKGGHSTCSGDSGGPLVLERDGTQVGLVSFGISFGCALGWPAAYTRVSSYLDWIEQNTDVKIL